MLCVLFCLAVFKASYGYHMKTEIGWRIWNRKLLLVRVCVFQSSASSFWTISEKHHFTLVILSYLPGTGGLEHACRPGLKTESQCQLTRLIPFCPHTLLWKTAHRCWVFPRTVVLPVVPLLLDARSSWSHGLSRTSWRSVSGHGSSWVRSKKPRSPLQHLKRNMLAHSPINSLKDHHAMAGGDFYADLESCGLSWWPCAIAWSS